MTNAALIFFAVLTGAFSMSALVWFCLGVEWRWDAALSLAAAVAALLMVAL